MHLLADKRGWYRWAGLIEPAGTMTLTCYLIPYFVYAIRALSGFTLPETWTTGGAGILKSLLFALLIIQLTGLLGKWKIKLKI
jgi:heparan-alpha-glucosaminide N-acetyltransferase